MRPARPLDSCGGAIAPVDRTCRAPTAEAALLALPRARIAREPKRPGCAHGHARALRNDAGARGARAPLRASARVRRLREGGPPVASRPSPPRAWVQRQRLRSWTRYTTPPLPPPPPPFARWRYLVRACGHVASESPAPLRSDPLGRRRRRSPSDAGGAGGAGGTPAEALQALRLQLAFGEQDGAGACAAAVSFSLEGEKAVRGHVRVRTSTGYLRPR